MAEQDQPTSEPAGVRLVRLLGLPKPAPWTDEQEREYQAWMDEGNAKLAEVIARRQRNAA